MNKELVNKLICILIGLVIGILLMIIINPKRIAKLSDGSEEIVKVNNKSISANEYYTLLKGKDNISMLLRHIDVLILKDKYKDREDKALEYAKDRYDTFIRQGELYNMDEEALLSYYGYSNKDDFMSYLKDDYYLHTYYEEVMKDKISEDDLKKYYDENYFPDKHIYVFSSATSSNDLNKIKKELDKGESVNNILKKYNKVASNDMDITFTDTSYGIDILGVVKNLNKNKTSPILNNDVFGYYVIYVDKVGEKQDFYDVRDKILNVKYDELEEEDNNLMYKVMLDLEKENNIKFSDTELEKKYKAYKDKYYR